VSKNKRPQLTASSIISPEWDSLLHANVAIVRGFHGLTNQVRYITLTVQTSGIYGSHSHLRSADGLELHVGFYQFSEEGGATDYIINLHT